MVVKEPAWIIQEKNEVLQKEMVLCASLAGALIGVRLAVIVAQHGFLPRSMWGLLAVIIAGFVGGFITRKVAASIFKDIDFFKGCE